MARARRGSVIKPKICLDALRIGLNWVPLPLLFLLCIICYRYVKRLSMGEANTIYGAGIGCTWPVHACFGAPGLGKSNRIELDVIIDKKQARPPVHSFVLGTTQACSCLARQQA
jgi:hypothetical protein